MNGIMKKIRIGPRASLCLESLPVQPERGQGETHPRAFADVICNPGTSLRIDMPDPAAHAPDSITDSYSKARPHRWPSSSGRYSRT